MSLQRGVYALHPDTYHADPADVPSLSAHVAHTLLSRSPLHAWTQHPKLNPEYRPTRHDKFDLGTAVHDLWLRGIDNVAVVDATDWRTKIAQEAKAEARANNQIPLLAKDWDRVREMTDAMREQIGRRDDDPPLFATGKPEQTLLWSENGVACRALVDWLHDSGRAIDDIKTCAGPANPHFWGRNTLFGIGGDLQARFNARGLKAITGREPLFRFVVVESHEPYALSVVSLAPSAVELADRKMDRAIELWKRCLDSGEWPGYPTDVAYAEVPPWEEQRFLEQHWEEEAA